MPQLMPKKIEIPQYFTFWKDNKIALKFERNQSELKELFWQYCEKKEKSWMEYYGSAGVINAFVGEKDGLSSVMEDNQREALRELLWPTYMEFIK